MPDQAPPPGLYQQLLSEGLEQQLRQVQESLVAWPDRNNPPAHPPSTTYQICGSASPSGCA